MKYFIQNFYQQLQCKIQNNIMRIDRIHVFFNIQTNNFFPTYNKLSICELLWTRNNAQSLQTTLATIWANVTASRCQLRILFMKVEFVAYIQSRYMCRIMQHWYNDIVYVIIPSMKYVYEWNRTILLSIL